MGVAGQVLDVLQRHILAQQVRDHQDAERVRREKLRQLGRLEPTFEHQLHGEKRHGPFGERTASPLSGSKERRPVRRLREPGPFKVGHDSFVEIVAYRDLPRLAPLFQKLQRPVFAVVPQVPDPQPTDGPDPGAGVNQGAQDRPVPEPVHVPASSSWASNS